MYPLHFRRPPQEREGLERGGELQGGGVGGDVDACLTGGGQTVGETEREGEGAGEGAVVAGGRGGGCLEPGKDYLLHLFGWFQVEPVLRLVLRAPAVTLVLTAERLVLLRYWSVKFNQMSHLLSGQ